ncbi:related to monooxigenase [Phialocephala subalpina]|uniref:Related to monooxigenase n=1 Tax=Phialocephala subalpina TaxID=576137 RepID=A0A1L7XNX4_9HELO|nr:related to monooxigenase [Phialocephala subalpina]
MGENHANGEHPPNWVPVWEQPIFNPKKLRIVCVGAGYSGLMLAYHMKNMNMESYIDLCIYEKNSDIGGVWFENRYPGAACDVPAHIYTFSFEPNPDWSMFYAGGSEIQAYIKRTAAKYGLDKPVRLNSKVVKSVWDETKKKWLIKVDQNGTIVEDEADVLVNASGIVNKWKMPNIEGLSDYKGKLVHSANWDATFDWTGKKVAVIGNGASGCQTVPHLQAKASKLVHFFRQPTWIIPNFVFQYARDGQNFAYTEDEKKEFRENPKKLYELRHEVEHAFNSIFSAFQKDSPQQAGFRQAVTDLMRQLLNNDENLIKQLVPDFPVGCRRITPNNGYLQAIQAPNASFSMDPIIRITETGIATSKCEEDFDLIVCATGFDSTFRPYWPVTGKNGISLNEKWKDNPQGYLGICAPDMPNYFMFVGPNSPYAHGDTLAIMEWTAEYILKWCKKIACEDISTVTVKKDIVDDFNIYSHEFLKRTVWAGGCRMWWKEGSVSPDGKITAMYAGSVLHFKEILENLRGEDFEIEYKSKNRFRFMGNGFTAREESDGDLAYFLTK